MRDRCRHALERGLQLWPAAEYAEYRLALDAPASFAGPVVVDGAGRFALGPLWEVAASTHTWSELGGEIPAGPARSLAAHERVLRGDTLGADADVDSLILELPLHLEAWEPEYVVATYRSGEADFSSPDPVRHEPLATDDAGEVFDDPETVEALMALATPWAQQSNGEVRAVAVEGDAPGAIGALGFESVLSAPVAGQDAVRWMAWAGANGGAYGRRPGGPMGRFGAWWAVASLAGIPWPPAEGEMASAVESLRWYLWEPQGTTHGWSMCLAVEDPDEGLSWALYAVDDHREEDALQP